MAIDILDLVEAFDFVSVGEISEHQAFLHKPTGKIFVQSDYIEGEEELPDDILSEEYIAIPHAKELGLGKDLVLEFTKEYAEDSLDEIDLLFRRKGAYSMFKSFLSDKELLQTWYDFENEKQIQKIKEWCEENNIEFSE